MPDTTIQKITVEVTPGASEKPVINASQFDIGRPFEIDLTWGGNDYSVPEGVYVEIHVKKPDRTIVTAYPDSIDGNACLFFTTEQMCACYGSNECEINLSDENDNSIGTGNFILEVEKDPILGGVESESEIGTLSRQVAVIADDVVRTIAPGIVMMEANEIVREKVGEIGGTWFQFTMDKTHTEDLIDVPGFKSDSIIENVYADTWDKITIKDITYVGGGGSYSRLKVYHNTYDDSDAVFYIHFFTLED